MIIAREAGGTKGLILEATRIGEEE